MGSFSGSVICPVFIGRVPERAAFSRLVEQTRSGQGQVALVSGEAGVGKSRLVAEVKATAASQGFLLLQGNCFQADGAFPCAPFLEVGYSQITGGNRLLISAAIQKTAQYSRA
jgi:predicted ATPase